jgi:lipid A 3-O-deacylase
MNNVSLRCIAQLSWALLLLFSRQLAQADASTGKTNSAPASSFDQLFNSGRFETALNSGVLFSPFGPSRMRPTLDYTLTGVQLGYMLSDVKGRGLLRGNFEVVGEGFGSSVFNGPGSYIAGGTLLLRYNFVPPNSRLIPYLQGGGGAVATDINREIVGQTFNFNLDACAGLRYFFRRDMCLDLEFRYQHISNANTGGRNLGINAAGPMLGLSYFF